MRAVGFFAMYGKFFREWIIPVLFVPQNTHYLLMAFPNALARLKRQLLDINAAGWQ